ncbi:hypothetical protein Hanom_Chr15g01354471 [Helianthus anomalus]
MRVTRVHHQFWGNLITHPPVGRTVKLPVKLVWLKDRTQVSVSLISLSTNASLCTK